MVRELSIQHGTRCESAEDRRFFSQTADENFYQLGVVFVLVLPNAFAQFGAREDAAGRADQHLQKHQLVRGEFDSSLAATDLVIN